jgi:RNA polymerase sigma factor (sigma-70 family)
VDPRPSADEQVAKQQQAEQFLRHLRALPLGQRQVLALALEGLSHQEIGAIVGITAENVAVRLGRAREAMRKSIEKEDAA